MKKTWAQPVLLILILIIGMAVIIQQPVSASGVAQLPTGSMATVTGTPEGPMVSVKANGSENQANLRSCAGQLCDRVGILLLGQKVPALGKSPKGEWIQVSYPGGPDGKAWVYSYLVDVLPVTAILPVVESPPTPTPAIAATIDPTLAAKFVITSGPTRLPTYTPPPPLAIPTFTDASTPVVSGVPMGFVILGLAALGLFIGLVAFLQR